MVEPRTITRSKLALEREMQKSVGMPPMTPHTGEGPDRFEMIFNPAAEDPARVAEAVGRYMEMAGGGLEAVGPLGCGPRSAGIENGNLYYLLPYLPEAAAR